PVSPSAWRRRRSGRWAYRRIDVLRAGTTGEGEVPRPGAREPAPDGPRLRHEAGSDRAAHIAVGSFLTLGKLRPATLEEECSHAGRGPPRGQEPRVPGRAHPGRRGG